MVVFSKCLSAKLSSGETYLMTESRDPPTDAAVALSSDCPLKFRPIRGQGYDSSYLPGVRPLAAARLLHRRSCGGAATL